MRVNIRNVLILAATASLLAAQEAAASYMQVQGAPLVVPSTTVALLPTCNAGSKGMLEMVTDATAPIALTSVAGSGTVSTFVVCNGTTWIVG